MPTILPKGTHVSQNNVAKESGCDPSALRKARFPLLIIEIQEWVDTHKDDRSVSERQKLIKQRQKSRDTKDTIADLKKQRDAAAGLLADANLRIVELSEKVAYIQTRLDALQPPAQALNFPKRGE